MWWRRRRWIRISVDIHVPFDGLRINFADDERICIEIANAVCVTIACASGAVAHFAVVNAFGSVIALPFRINFSGRIALYHHTARE